MVIITSLCILDDHDIYGLVTETVNSNDDVRPQQSLVLWTSYTPTGEKPHELTRVTFVSFYIISNHFACIADQRFFFFFEQRLYLVRLPCVWLLWKHVFNWYSWLFSWEYDRKLWIQNDKVVEIYLVMNT